MCKGCPRTSVKDVPGPYLGFSIPSQVAGWQRARIYQRFGPIRAAAAIAQLIESAELRSRIGQSGLRLVRECFDVERSLDRYVALYRELADAQAS